MTLPLKNSNCHLMILRTILGYIPEKPVYCLNSWKEFDITLLATGKKLLSVFAKIAHFQSLLVSEAYDSLKSFLYPVGFSLIE